MGVSYCCSPLRMQVPPFSTSGGDLPGSCQRPCWLGCHGAERPSYEGTVLHAKSLTFIEAVLRTWEECLVLDVTRFSWSVNFTSMNRSTMATTSCI